MFALLCFRCQGLGENDPNGNLTRNQSNDNTAADGNQTKDETTEDSNALASQDTQDGDNSNSNGNNTDSSDGSGDVSSNGDDSKPADASVKGTAKTITQYGITWTFSEAIDYGQFVTGDYYIVDSGAGVTVVSVNPPRVDGENGSMKNPVPGAGQGFTARGSDYEAELAVALPVSLTSGDAFLSSISSDGNETVNWAGKNVSSHAKLRTVAVLTVMSKHPPAGTFRPSYSDRSQTLYSTAQIDRSVLPEKEMTAAIPAHAKFETLAYFERGMERPWILFGSNWQSRAVHPIDNMENYHENIGFFLSEVSVLLTTDIANKERLINRYIQVGIDYHYNHSDSSIWAWPVVFTGLLLGEPEMYNFWIDHPDVRTERGHEKLYYPEDVQVATASSIIPANQTWVDWKTPAGRYVAFRKQAGEEYEHLHPSEWTCYKPHCKSEVYRTQHDVYPLIGLTLASILVDQKIEANVNAMLAHDPLRDYADRWMSNVYNTGTYAASGKTYIQEMQATTSFTIYNYNYGSGGTAFIDEMWATYRE